MSFSMYWFEAEQIIYKDNNMVEKENKGIT